MVPDLGVRRIELGSEPGLAQGLPGILAARGDPGKIEMGPGETPIEVHGVAQGLRRSIEIAQAEPSRSEVQPAFRIVRIDLEQLERLALLPRIIPEMPLRRPEGEQGLLVIAIRRQGAFRSLDAL